MHASSHAAMRLSLVNTRVVPAPVCDTSALYLYMRTARLYVFNFLSFSWPKSTHMGDSGHYPVTITTPYHR